MRQVVSMDPSLKSLLEPWHLRYKISISEYFLRTVTHKGVAGEVMEGVRHGGHHREGYRPCTLNLSSSSDTSEMRSVTALVNAS